MLPLPLAITLPVSVLWACAGLAVGSFLSVVIARLPVGKGLGGRSQCTRCKTVLGPLELLPVVSFFLLGGRCRTCRKPISWRYPLLELLCMVLFIVALWREGFWPVPGAGLSLALACLLAITIIDADTQTIPDILSVSFIVLAGITAAAGGRFSLLAALIGPAFFAAQWLLSRGRWVGSADILLALGIGLLLGDWRRVVISLLVAYACGAVVAVILLWRGAANRNSAIAFGPFLAFGALAGLLVPASFLRFLFPL